MTLTCRGLARDGRAAHGVGRVYRFWTDTPSVRVKISTTIGRKLDALRAHASQLKDFDRVEGWIRESSGATGKEIGVEAAEGFHLIIVDEDDEEPKTGDESESA